MDKLDSGIQVFYCKYLNKNKTEKKDETNRLQNIKEIGAKVKNYLKDNIMTKRK